MNYHFAKKPYQYTERVVKVDLRTQFLATEYHPLIIGDEIEHNGFHNIMNEDFKYSIEKILRDLNFLLQVRNKQFWDHLKTQQSLAESEQNEKILVSSPGSKTRLRGCLESCLIVFSRLEYYQYSQMKSSPPSLQILKSGKDKINQSQSDQSHYQQNEASVWYELKRVVLFIFYRISNAQTIEQKQIVFQNWFLDTCKLLDICLIYGLYNPQIVRKIISNVFAIKRDQYKEDFLNCVPVLRTRFQQICEELKDYTIDLEQISRSTATIRKYQNPSKNFIQRLMKTLFGVYDVCLNIESIYNYFPYEEKIQVLKHTLIFKRLILIYNKIRYHADFKWKFAEHHKILIDVLNLIFKKIVHLLQISILHIIKQFKKKENPHLYEMKKTYINICYFTAKFPTISWEDRDNTQKKKMHSKYCQQLVKNIILFDPSKVLFPKGLTNLFISNQNSKGYILTMSKFQKKFKEQIIIEKQFRKKQQKYKWGHLKKSLTDYFAQKKKMELIKQQKIRIQIKQYQDEPIQQQDEGSYNQGSQKINLTDTNTPEHHLETDMSKISKDLFKKSKDQSGRHNQSDYFGKKQQTFGKKFHWDTNSQFELSSINANESQYYLLEDVQDFELFDNNSDTSDVNTIFTQFSGLKNDFPQFL